MSKVSKWLDGVTEVRRVLKECHQDRHNEGRAATIARAAEMERLRDAGEEARAAQLEEREWKKSTQFMRAKRQAEAREAERELRKLGAAIRRETRKLFKHQPPEALFQQFEAEQRLKGFKERDLYYDWIGRGLGSGKKREYTRVKKRSSARTTPWKSGEMGRKIRYIFREDALEDVEGNTLHNMGEDIVEAVACSRLLQELEEIGREKNGGVYHHVIIALPHKLSPEERARLLKELVQPLQDLSLPFCASLHKPDRRGDERNFHAHVLLSLRPFERVGEYQWEFSPTKRTWLDTPAGLRLQRKFVSRCFNRALSRAGVQERWTHKSLTDRGLKSPGNTKKGPERTRSERDEDAAARAYRDARKLYATVRADERAAAMLDRAQDIMQASGPVLQQCAEGVVSQFRELAATCAEALSTLDVTATALSKLEDEGRSLERTPGPDRAKDEVEASYVQALEPARHSVELPSRALGDDDIKRARRWKRKLQEIARADERAIKEMAEIAGGDPPSEAFNRLCQAIRAGSIRQSNLGDGLHRVFAKETAVLGALVACIETDKGKAYLRAVIEALPDPPENLKGWRTATVRQAPDPLPRPQPPGPAQESGLTVEQLIEIAKAARERE